MKSTSSLAVTKMSVIESLVLLSKGGIGIVSSSNLDTKLKYLFNSSHFLSFIQILDLKKASGLDKISHKMLKIAPEKIAEPLQIIFNKSLRQGKYPPSWKIAHVIAILKKGDASLPSNYRPISLISCVGKIMETDNWWIVECFGRKPD
jgi:hypothetical protein